MDDTERFKLLGPYKTLWFPYGRKMLCEMGNFSRNGASAKDALSTIKIFAVERNRGISGRWKRSASSSPAANKAYRPHIMPLLDALDRPRIYRHLPVKT